MTLKRWTGLMLPREWSRSRSKSQQLQMGAPVSKFLRAPSAWSSGAP